MIQLIKYPRENYQVTRANKERSWKAYIQECASDKRLLAIRLIAIAVLIVIVFLFTVSAFFMLLVVPVIWAAVKLQRKVKRIIKRQYLYL